jgi:hypothetical protein
VLLLFVKENRVPPKADASYTAREISKQEEKMRNKWTALSVLILGVSAIVFGVLYAQASYNLEKVREANVQLDKDNGRLLVENHSLRKGILIMDGVITENQNSTLRKEAVGKFALSWLAVGGSVEWDDPAYVMLWNGILGNTTDITMEFVPSGGHGKLEIPFESNGMNGTIRYVYSSSNRDFTIEILDKEGNVIETYDSRVLFEPQSVPSE